jgi:molybdopterin-binding protein
MSAAYHLNEVRFRYGGRDALNIDQLKLTANRISAIVGPNGAGKTTLLNLLAFLESPLTGNITFFGAPYGKLENLKLRRRVGLVQQNPYLLRGTVLANVELGLKLRGVDKAERTDCAMDVLAQMRLSAKAQVSAAQLSGGEAQKVAIGRILVLEPEVLLLDEPFTYLDRGVIDELEVLLATIRDNRSQTVIFTTHDQLRAQALADSIHSIVDGRVIPASLINLYRGQLQSDNHVFDTGKLAITVPEKIRSGDRIAIEPIHIVLSATALQSTMRNAFEGRITALREQDGQVQVTVEAGERFHATITHASLEDLNLGIGKQVWVSFKSSAVRVF